MEPRQAITPRPRVRKTRRSVLIADRVSRWLISISGIGTILAVTLVFVFLVAVVFPLFLGASVEDEREVSLPPTQSDRPVAFRDTRRLLAWSLAADGTATVRRLDDDRVLEK